MDDLVANLRRECRAIRYEERAKRTTSASDIMTNIKNETVAIRRKMTERYQIEFELDSTTFGARSHLNVSMSSLLVLSCRDRLTQLFYNLIRYFSDVFSDVVCRVASIGRAPIFFWPLCEG